MLSTESPGGLSSLIARLRSWWLSRARGNCGSQESSAPSRDRIIELEARCVDLEERLRGSDSTLRERTQLLYDLKRQYATEHFTLYESVRDLNIERLRNAGAYTSRDTILKRARDLQARIGDLKQRLRVHESVDDLYFDQAPVVIEAPE